MKDGQVVWFSLIGLSLIVTGLIALIALLGRA
jgi:hypothetical protein